MRKSFLTATLLATAASFAAAPVAPSHSAEPKFNLGISGETRGFVVYHNGKVSTTSTNESGTTTTTSSFLNPQFEVQAGLDFKAMMMYEGFIYATQLQVDASSTADPTLADSEALQPGQILNSSRFFLTLGNNSYGMLFLGAVPGAAAQKFIFMPGAGVNTYSLFASSSTASHSHDILTWGGTLPWYAGEYNKMVYTSPDFYGFSFATSYTPIRKRGQNFGTPTEADLAGIPLNVFELQGKFEMDGLSLSGGIATQDTNGSVVFTENFSYNLLASYTMDGLSVGIGYQVNPNFVDIDYLIYGGVQYQLSDEWSLGAGYLYRDAAVVVVSEPEDKQLLVLNANYAISQSVIWKVGATIPLSSGVNSDWSVATGLAYKFGPNV
jgi:opacity protein-like surface antigen